MTRVKIKKNATAKTPKTPRTPKSEWFGAKHGPLANQRFLGVLGVLAVLGVLGVLGVLAVLGVLGVLGVLAVLASPPNHESIFGIITGKKRHASNRSLN